MSDVRLCAKQKYKFFFPRHTWPAGGRKKKTQLKTPLTLLKFTMRTICAPSHPSKKKKKKKEKKVNRLQPFSHKLVWLSLTNDEYALWICALLLHKSHSLRLKWKIKVIINIIKEQLISLVWNRKTHIELTCTQVIVLHTESVEWLHQREHAWTSLIFSTWQKTKYTDY